jgi:hypothetical protein
MVVASSRPNTTPRRVTGRGRRLSRASAAVLALLLRAMIEVRVMTVRSPEDGAEGRDRVRRSELSLRNRPETALKGS